DPRAQLVGDLPPLGPSGFGIVLGEGGADEGRDDAAALLAAVSQHVAHEVDAAALPGRVQDLRDGSLQPLMGIRDDELDTAQTAPRELARKRSVSGPVQAAARVALNGCQFQGRSSAIRRAGWSAMRT